MRPWISTATNVSRTRRTLTPAEWNHDGGGGAGGASSRGFGGAGGVTIGGRTSVPTVVVPTVFGGMAVSGTVASARQSRFRRVAGVPVGPACAEGTKWNLPG